MRENKSIVFDSIFRRTYSRLYFYALSLLSDESDADDVVEEVFAGLWRRMDEIDLEDNIEGFLYRAVYTRSVNVLKRRNVDAGRLAAIEDINNMRMEYYSGMNDDIVTVDVSFISLTYILPALVQFLDKDSVIIALVKPQFEVGRAELTKSGIVKSRRAALKAVDNVKTFAGQLGLCVSDTAEAPHPFVNKNYEYLVAFRKKL